MSTFSVTNEPCKCGLLERYANDPEQPIFFDPETNEYHFKTDKGKICLRHCFFCGGKTPESHRSQLFASVSQPEKERLTELTKNIKSLEQAISQFGLPDFEAPEIETDITPRQDKKPEITRSFRTLTYSKLSETADVLISDRQERGIKIYFQGKYIRKNKKNQAQQKNRGDGE